MRRIFEVSSFKGKKMFRRFAGWDVCNKCIPVLFYVSIVVSSNAKRTILCAHGQQVVDG